MSESENNLGGWDIIVNNPEHLINVIKYIRALGYSSYWETGNNYTRNNSTDTYPARIYLDKEKRTYELINRGWIRAMNMLDLGRLDPWGKDASA